MNICPECGFQNPKDLHICLRCAASLQRFCPACGAEVTGNNKFCGQCGMRLEESLRVKALSEDKDRSRPNIHEQLLKNLRDSMPASLTQKINQYYTDQLHGQRREVTILCVDIANLEQASTQIDSEELFLAIDHLMHLLTQVVYQYEGTIDQFSGQGLTALFGIPINHENDPERAVRAAFSMAQELNQEQEEINERFHFGFQIRLGINTGSVILGQMGSQQHVEYTVIGDTVNLANILLGAASSGEILVSFSTFQRTAHVFDFQSHSIQTSMDSASLLVYKPLRLKYTPGQVRGLAGLHVPMVGRLDDINLMQGVKEQALSNAQSHIILISGEAGLGKTRLVAEFVNAQKDVNVFWGTCAAYMRITPYRIIANVIRNILGVSEIDPILHQREALEHHLVKLGLAQPDILPNLLHVLGLLHSDPVVEARLKLFEPNMLQRETQLSLRTYFTKLTQGLFSIFILDDLHWVDQASQQFLEYYCQVIEDNPLMLILVSRDFKNYEPSRLIAEAANKHTPAPTLIQLEPLSFQDTRILIDQFIPEKTDHATLIKNSIVNRSAGIPFYTEELVRILMDFGGLRFEGDHWHLTIKADNLLDEVPGTLQDIILARFDRLPNHLRQTAQRASVFGDSFATRLIESTFSSSREELRANLAELEARDFLIHTRLGNEDGYLFKHPLLQETIYKTLLRRDIRDLHFEIAQAIEAGDHWLPAERNQVLAWHYGESHTPMLAIPFLFASAENASQHFANETVIQLYRQVLELMEKDPAKYKEQILQAKIHLGQALKFTGLFEEAAQIFQALIDEESSITGEATQKTEQPSSILIDSLRELADLWAREGNLDKAVTLLKHGMQTIGDGVQTKDPIAWRRLVDRLAWVYFRQGKLEEAHNWADLALMDLKSGETDDPITLASLSNTLGGIYWSRSRYQEAITSVERSLAIYRDLGYQWGVSISLTNLGVLNFSIGKWQTCVEYLERADQIRSDFGNHPERPINLVNLGEVFIAMGDYERAREKLDTSLEIAQRLGLSIYCAYTEMKLAFLAILEENSQDAHEHLDKSKELLAPLEEISERTVQFFDYNARLRMLDGDLPAALADGERALDIANQGGFIEKKIDVLQTLGCIQIQLGNYELAEAHLEQSINLKGDQYSEAQGLLELGHLFLLRAQSNPQEAWAWYQQADNLLDRVIGDFLSLGAQRHLQRAQMLHAMIPTRMAEHSQLTQPLSTEDDIQTITSLRKSLGIPDGEWYQATILTIEMVPNQTVDEELLFETIAFLIPLLQERIQANGGKVIRLQNNITGIFGTPVAHEDDPVRAVETAMQMVNFHTELYQQTRLPVSIRLGITMGRIIAGKSDQNQNAEFIASGQPLLFSRTLAKLASPSRVWVTQEVYNSTSYRFQFNHVSLDMVTQLEEKNIFQLEGEREQILPVRGLIGLKTNFVGRQSEINTLVESSFKLFDNIGRIVWLEGDPGIGKSRLTRELENIVSSRGILVLRGTCTTRRSDIAFSVFSELISAALGIQPNYSSEQIHTQIERQISERTLDPDLRPIIELLVGVQPSGLLGNQLMALEPEQLRRQIFVSLNRFISWLVSKQPIILIIDDIQWIDSISVDLLLYLSPLIFSLGVMFICIQRLNESSPYETNLTRIRNLTAQQLLHLQLKPLSSQEVHTLLNQILGEAELEVTVKSLIVQQSGGNPYYIEEFLRMLVEQDYLRVVSNKLEINQSFEIDDLHIPSSLETLIRARIDSLPASSRQLLQVASVIGRQFGENLLNKVSEQSDVGSQLAILQDRGMLHFSQESNLWEFGHPMIEIIVYNSVLKVQRRILHNRTAQALEVIWQGQESEHADELAYHYGKADNHAKTLDYLILAGERAASRYANDAAMAYFEQAYDLLSAVAKIDDLQRYRIITGLGLVYQFTGKFDVSVATLQTGLDLLKETQLTPDKYASLYRILAESFFQKGDLDQSITHLQKALSFVSQPDLPAGETEAARINNRLGWCYFRKADLDQAQSAVVKAVEFAANTKNLAAQAAAENLLGGINWSMGNTTQAMKHTRQAMLYFQELGYTWGEAIALNNLAILEANSGNWNAAANFFQRTLSLRVEMGDVEGIALTHNNLGELALDQGKISEAEASFNSSLSVSEPLKINFHQAVSYIGLVRTSLAQQHLKETARMLKIAFRQATEVDASEKLAELMRLEAELFLANGEYDQADKQCGAALQAAVEINNSLHESSARRIWSETKLRISQPAQGVVILDEAWERLSKSVEELETGRVHAQYARLYNALGDPVKTSQHRAAAEKIFTSLGAELDLKKLSEIQPASPS